MKTKIFIIFIVLIANIYSCRKDENICAYPCDVVSYQNGFKIKNEDCMGESLDSDTEYDDDWRTKRWEVEYENVTIVIDNIKYNDIGQVTSFNATTTKRRRSVETTFYLIYSIDHRLIKVRCE